jgi:hypothetical protein
MAGAATREDVARHDEHGGTATLDMLLDLRHTVLAANWPPDSEA